MNKKRIVLLLALCLCLLLGCGKPPKTVLFIAEQFGTAYAPVTLMRERGLLAARLPEGVSVEWSQLANTAAIREAMLANKANIGFMAIPPFLIGKDGGMEWRICAGLSRMPMGLAARDPSIASLADIPASARIALPQPGSIQHILLAMAAERELGDPTRFDNQLVTLSHPDGMSALLAGGEIDLHFTTAPYLGQELASGMHLVLSGEEAMGSGFTGIVAVSTDAFIEEERALYESFLAALQEAVAYINDNPASSAEILAAVYGMTAEDVLNELTAEGAGYGLQVEGLREFADFLYRTGYVQQSYEPASLIAEGVELIG